MTDTVVVLASRHDQPAQRLVADWADYGAALLTPADLSRPGWVLSNTDPAASRAVVDGTELDSSSITGVVNRLPGVGQRDLDALHPDDRVYAASEMSAFLRYWLSTLSCPVLNPPSRGSLNAPGWRSERWLLLASSLGIPVRPRRHQVLAIGTAPPQSDDPGGALQEVAVVGDRVVAVPPAGYAGSQALDPRGLPTLGHARALAEAAGVPSMTFRFTGPEDGSRLVETTPWVDINDDTVREAVLEHLGAGPTATEGRS